MFASLAKVVGAWLVYTGYQDYYSLNWAVLYCLLYVYFLVLRCEKIQNTTQLSTLKFVWIP